MKYRTIFNALKIQEEIVILQEIQELQDSVPGLHTSMSHIDFHTQGLFFFSAPCFFSREGG